MRERILDGFSRCIARWGVTKTTLDDIAREAGCSRATLYRVFPGGKESLVQALVATEVQRFFAGLDAQLAAVDDLEDLLVAGTTYAGRALREHAALRFLLAHEPEVILPRISFRHMDDVLRVASAFVSPYLAPHVGADEAPRAAEWLVRMVVSYVVCPADGIDVVDPESVRRLVRTYVLPGLVPLAAHTGS